MSRRHTRAGLSRPAPPPARVSRAGAGGGGSREATGCRCFRQATAWLLPPPPSPPRNHHLDLVCPPQQLPLFRGREAASAPVSVISQGQGRVPYRHHARRSEGLKTLPWLRPGPPSRLWRHPVAQALFGSRGHPTPRGLLLRLGVCSLRNSVLRRREFNSYLLAPTKRPINMVQRCLGGGKPKAAAGRLTPPHLEAGSERSPTVQRSCWKRRGVRFRQRSPRVALACWRRWREQRPSHLCTSLFLPPT
ncbi:uncharacterized protein [Manis javanica]|uniref:uncharacterized protein n=1 Tax=Manis javanica TaxID=9974 RepID=UPI00187955F6|nr:uncharacterized protein LOC118969373 [Manis javanica]